MKNDASYACLEATKENVEWVLNQCREDFETGVLNGSKGADETDDELDGCDTCSKDQKSLEEDALAAEIDHLKACEGVQNVRWVPSRAAFRARFETSSAEFRIRLKFMKTYQSMHEEVARQRENAITFAQSGTLDAVLLDGQQ